MAALARVDAGEGPPVVFVHGSVSDYRAWAAQRAAFAPEFRFIAYSRRHHWPDNPPPDADIDYRMADHVDDLGAIIDEVGGRAAVVGHSYGGYVSLMAALKWPDRVTRLVLAEPPVIPIFTSFPPKPHEILWLFLTRPATAAAIMAVMAGGLGPARAAAKKGDFDAALAHFAGAVLGPGRLAAMPEARREQARENIFLAEMDGREAMLPIDPEAVRRLAVRTLLVDGEDSPAMFRRLTDRLEELLADVERVAIPDASHNMIEDNPDAFNRAVLAFLKR